ncbi:MAG: DUF5320 domain-containing protein, partial [bacterium]
MPGGDRTGPMGMGPMSGRGAGYCAGYGVSGYMNPAMGRGLGMGRGRGGFGGGRGWRHRYYATGLPGWARFAGGMAPYVAPHVWGVPYREPDPEVEKQVLRDQAEMLESELAALKKRLG